MNNQDIVDNAPEGSTHIDEDGTYFKRTYGQAYCWVNKSTWITAKKSRAMRSLADIKQNVELEKEVVKANMKLIDCALDITEIEKEVKHLSQVAYNTSKVSFESGACCPYVDFHEHAILFAKKITKEKVK